MLEPINSPVDLGLASDLQADCSTEQLCDWLDQHIRFGGKVRCESLFAQFPRIAEDSDAALDLIYTEYTACIELNGLPTREEYYARFPKYQDALKQQFDLGELFDDPARDNSALDNPVAEHCGWNQPLETMEKPQGNKQKPRFKLIKLLARGGLGQVMQALDTELNREVAVKEIQSQFAGSPSVRQRFLREAEITGRLEHPGVVPVYGLGYDASNRPYYAMRLVRGQSLLDAINDYHGKIMVSNFRSTAFQGLLRRFLSVCDTISYAHSRGVIHRDLKPANILLGPFGETLVVDWGLAKATPLPPTSCSSPQEPLEQLHDRMQNECDVSNELNSNELNGVIEPESDARVPVDWSVALTQSTGALIGTPAYMSPEQARGEPDTIGAASDIYNLGATLFVLLTGRPRFEAVNVQEALQSILKADFPNPRSMLRCVPRGLDAICMKALEFEPAKRYASASELARDIEHYLADEQVSALDESIASRAVRFGRRHRALALAGMLVLVILSIVSIAAAVRIDGERKQADLQRIAAQRGSARLAFDRGFQLIEHSQFGEGLLWLERALQQIPPQDNDMRRVLLTNMSAARHHLLRRHAILMSEHLVYLLLFSPDGKTLLTIDRKGKLKYWNPDSGAMLGEYDLQVSRVVAANIDASGVVRIWTGAEKQLSLYEHAVASSEAPRFVRTDEQAGKFGLVSTTADGQQVVTCTQNEAKVTICVSSAQDGRRLAQWTVKEIPQQILFDEQRQRLLVVDKTNRLHFWNWNADSKMYVSAGSMDNVSRILPLNNSKHMIVCTPGGRVSSFDAVTKKLAFDFEQHAGNIIALVASPDSQSVVAVWDNGVARSWNLQQRRPACELLRVDRYVSRLAFRPHSRQVAIVATRQTELWELPDPNASSITLPVRDVAFIEFSRDGTRAIVATRDRNVHVLDAETAKMLVPSIRHNNAIKSASFHPEGRTFLTCSLFGPVRLWDAATGKLNVSLIPDNKAKLPFTVAAFSHDGDRVATGDQTGTLSIWESASGKQLLSTDRIGSSIIDLCFSPDGQSVLTSYGLPDASVRSWDCHNGHLLWSGQHAGVVRHVAISPDGRYAASASNDATARLWNAFDGSMLAELPCRGQVFVARFSPDSKRLATSGYDATVRQWQVPSGQLFGEPMMHEGLTPDVAYSHDGRRLLSGSVDGTSRLWDVETCLPLSAPLPNLGPVLSVALHPTQPLAISGRLWNLPSPLPDEPQLIERWTRLATGRKLTTGNNIQWIDTNDMVTLSNDFKELTGQDWQHWGISNPSQ